MWTVYPEVTAAFSTLSQTPDETAVCRIMPLIEQFVVYMYDRASDCDTVDKARKELFAHKARPMEAIPPTSAALFQHVKRTAYQAGYCWGQAQVAVPTLPSPASWGWKEALDQSWEPLWTTLPQASETCLEFLKCGCNVELGCRCRGRCRCVQAGAPCTPLCKCGGDCDRY